MHKNLPYQSKSVDIDALHCFCGSRLPEILETVAEVRANDTSASSQIHGADTGSSG